MGWDRMGELRDNIVTTDAALNRIQKRNRETERPRK